MASEDCAFGPIGFERVRDVQVRRWGGLGLALAGAGWSGMGLAPAGLTGVYFHVAGGELCAVQTRHAGFTAFTAVVKCSVAGHNAACLRPNPPRGVCPLPPAARRDDHH